MVGELGPWGIYQNLMVSCYYHTHNKCRVDVGVRVPGRRQLKSVDYDTSY